MVLGPNGCWAAQARRQMISLPPLGQIPEYTPGLVGSKGWKNQDKKVKYDWCAMYVCIGLMCVKYKDCKREQPYS